MNKQELEKKFPIGLMVDLLGTASQGKIVGNHRILYPAQGNVALIKESHPNSKIRVEKTKGEWFVDVEINNEIKPLNVMLLSNGVKY